MEDFYGESAKKFTEGLAHEGEVIFIAPEVVGLAIGV
jgi:hypothetical protein